MVDQVNPPEQVGRPSQTNVVDQSDQNGRPLVDQVATPKKEVYYSRDDISSLIEIPSNTIKNWFLKIKATKDDYIEGKNGIKLYSLTYIKKVLTKLDKYYLLEKFLPETDIKSSVDQVNSPEQVGRPSQTKMVDQSDQNGRPLVDQVATPVTSENFSESFQIINILKEDKKISSEKIDKLIQVIENQGKIIEKQNQTIEHQNTTIESINKTVQNQQILTLKLQEKIDLLLTVSKNETTEEEQRKRKRFLGIF